MPRVPVVLDEVERGSACAQFVDRRYCKVPTGDLEGGHGLISFFLSLKLSFFFFDPSLWAGNYSMDCTRDGLAGMGYR